MEFEKLCDSLRADYDELKREKNELEVRLLTMYGLLVAESDRAQRIEDRYKTKDV